MIALPMAAAMIGGAEFSAGGNAEAHFHRAWRWLIDGMDRAPTRAGAMRCVLVEAGKPERRIGSQVWRSRGYWSLARKKLIS
jgi:hypothetical protein